MQGQYKQRYDIDRFRSQFRYTSHKWNAANGAQTPSSVDTTWSDKLGRKGRFGRCKVIGSVDQATHVVQVDGLRADGNKLWLRYFPSDIISVGQLVPVGRRDAPGRVDTYFSVVVEKLCISWQGEWLVLGSRRGNGWDPVRGGGSPTTSRGRVSRERVRDDNKVNG